MISKEQANEAADALLLAERANHPDRQTERLASQYPELKAWPESQRLAVWREACAAVAWQRPMVLTVILCTVPSLVLLGLAAWSLAHGRRYPLPYLLPMVAPLGLMAIQFVRRRCVRKALREMSPPGR
jgi:hypothetical protein